MTFPRYCPRLADILAQEVRLTPIQGPAQGPIPGPIQGPVRPADRYGSRRSPRWLPALLLVAVLALATVIAVVGFRNLGSPPIQGRQTAFRVIDDGTVEVTFQVVRRQPERAAVCIVRARSRDGDETGRKEVFVPAGPGSAVASTVLRTSRRAVTGEVFGCSYDVPPYLEPASTPSQLIFTK